MESRETPLGELIIAEQEVLFERMAAAVTKAGEATASTAAVGLTGGSTPKAWYRWATANRVFHPKTHRHIIWSTSDERRVPIEDGESNFGNAYRLMLEPLGFPEDKFFPWTLDIEPVAGAMAFESQWATRFGPEQAFDVCFLGMGDDCHTASLFPGSPLIRTEKENLFLAVDVPGKGWRYTLTPRGLACCGRILVTIVGAGKREALKRALDSDSDPEQIPIHLLAAVRDRVTLLADPDAAALL